MSSALIGRMKDTVVWEPFSDDSDMYGDSSTYGTAVTFRAQVQYSPDMSRTDIGQEEVPARVAYIATGEDTVIDTKDRITFDDGTQLPILRVQRWPGLHGRIPVVKVTFAATRRASQRG